MTNKTPADTKLFASMVADKQGWVVNDDATFVDMLLDGLTVNWNRYGYYLCPCRDSDGSREVDAHIVCPCVYARADIERYGYCYCALYQSRAFAESGQKPTGIPDRRYT